MRRLLLSSSALVVGLAAVAAVGAPAIADGASPATCLSDCTAVFDTAGAHSFTAPATATSLTVTVKGGAGAVDPVAKRLFSDAVGGPGGNATVDLGADFDGASFDLVVGGTGGGTSVATDGDLLALAGGGGGGGYVGRLDLRDVGTGDLDQISAAYPGGTGGSPTAAGVTPGTAGTAFGGSAANGQGATSAPGAGGTGVAPGSAGTPSNDSTPVAGGAGGTRVIPATDGTSGTFTGGAGGGGYAGGGGGAVTTVDAGDDTNDLVAAGGGGSGFLAAGLTATAGEPNAGTGSVTFDWSFSPTASTTSTTVHPGDTVTVDITGLPANVAFTEVFDGRTVATGGVSDADGAATATFTVPADQVPGSFPVQTLVGGVLAASTSALTVVVDGAAAPSGSGTPAALAETGTELPVGGMTAAVLLIAAGAVLLAARRRVAARTSR